MVRQVFKMKKILFIGLILFSNGYCFTAFRLTDFLRENSQINFSTTDGFLYNFSINSLNDFSHQDFGIILDGHSLDFSCFGRKYINSLPVNINKIREIKVIPNPVVKSGRFFGNGLVEITTNRQDTGISNQLLLGNESKDAGPYKFTPYQTPNVDKIGYDYAGSWGTKFFGQHLQTSLHFRQNISTDWSLRNRLQSVSPRWPMTRELGGAVNSHGKLANKYQYSLFLSSVFVDNIYNFSNLAGHEIPVNYFNNFIGGRVAHNINNDMNLTVDFNYESVITTHDLQLNVRKNFNGQELLNSRFSFQFPNNFLLKSLGAGFDYRRVVTELPDDLSPQFIPNFNLRFSVNTKRGGHLSLDEYFSYFKDVLFSNFILQYEQVIHKSFSLYSIFSMEELIPTSNMLWQYSHDRIYNNIKQEDDNKAQKYTVDFGLNYQPISEIKCYFTLFARRFKNGMYPSLNYQYDAKNQLFSSPEKSIIPASGIVKGGTLGLLWKPSDFIKITLHYTLKKVLSVNPVFLEAWEKIPQNHLNYCLTLTPAQSFQVKLGIYHQSQTQWREFQQVDGIAYFSTYNTDYQYRDHLDSRNRIDLKMKKTFLQNKLALSLMLQNLTDQKNYYHPAGASFDMSMFLGIEYNFQ